MSSNVASSIDSGHVHLPSLASLVLSNWQWHWLLFLFLTYEIWGLFKIQRIHPRNVKIVGLSTLLGQRLAGVYYAFFAQKLIQGAYDSAEDRAWAIPTRDKYNICVPTSKLIEEFNSASVHDVSLQGAVHELFPPDELYDGMPVGDVPGNLGLSQATFKSNLRSHLPVLQPILRKRMEEAFHTELQGKQVSEGWTQVALWRATYRMAARLNSLVIVGEELSGDPRFSKALMQYLHNATVAEEAIRMVPTILKPVVGTIIMRKDSSMRTLINLITAQMHERIESTEETREKPMDVAQWSIDRSRNATVFGLVRHILATLFASTHQIPVLIAFAFYRLCLHPEYIEPLRQEAESFAGNAYSTHNEEMPLLDSFLKEVARLHPITIVSMPHKVLSPFTFSDGTHVPPGNWISIPQQAIMQDPALYPDPTNFQGFRFINRDAGATTASESRFSHPSWKFPYWGTIRQACPARFYVSMMSKMIAAHFLLHYDFKLEDEKARATFTWGIASVPHPRLRILVRPRES